jgi:hypothetical protein
VASLNLHGLEMYDAPCDEDIFDGLNPITFLKCSPSRNALLLLLLLLFFERDVENIRFPSLSFPNFIDDFIARAPASEKEEEDKEDKEEEEVEQEENSEDALLAQRDNARGDLVMFF